MKLSIIIPCFNEQNTVYELIKKVKEADIGDIKKEIIVVDDCSTDQTLNILKSISDISLIESLKNQGKGSAIRIGLNYINGEIVIIQDADLEYDPRDYKFLIDPIIKEQYSVVYGSRRLKKNNNYSNILFFYGGILVTIVTNILYPSAKLTDQPTCYKVFDKDVIKSLKLESKGFEFCSEVTAKLLKKGYKIKELPISYYPRKKSEGKKISWKDGIIAILTLLKYRFKKI